MVTSKEASPASSNAGALTWSWWGAGWVRWAAGRRALVLLGALWERLAGWAAMARPPVLILYSTAWPASAMGVASSAGAPKAQTMGAAMHASACRASGGKHRSACGEAGCTAALAAAIARERAPLPW